MRQSRPSCSTWIVARTQRNRYAIVCTTWLDRCELRVPLSAPWNSTSSRCLRDSAGHSQSPRALAGAVAVGAAPPQPPSSSSATDAADERRGSGAPPPPPSPPTPGGAPPNENSDDDELESDELRRSMAAAGDPPEP